MRHAPPTRPSLIVRLRDHRDHEAWAQFVEVYAPLIYAYVRKRGLQDADAADLTQACLRQVALHVGTLEYQPGHGSFRGWLFTIVRNKLRDFRRRAGRQTQGSGNAEVQQLLESQPAPAAEVDAWEREYQYSLLLWAAEQVRPVLQETTWQAFWQTAVEGKPGQEVAAALGLTVAAVYVAKSRVMARLRELIRQAQEDE
jgi:RNA polymerase sigma-70 factor (ECF subfamily)